jgi:hypothetical protein
MIRDSWAWIMSGDPVGLSLVSNVAISDSNRLYRAAVKAKIGLQGCRVRKSWDYSIYLVGFN